MDGVALCARFSIATNRLQFCGPSDAEPALYRAITTEEGHAEARNHLSRFEALMPYLEAIGRKHGLDPFDPRVVEAYWIGNELLDDFSREDFRALIGALVRRGLPRSLGDDLVQRLPANPIPHHMFHVAYVGVGSVTGHVETTLANMESCRPAWATIERKSPSTIQVQRPTLSLRAGRLVLGPPASLDLTYDPRALPEIEVGQAVAIHWGWPALQLDAQRTSSLIQYTQRSLDAASGPSSWTASTGH